MDSVRIGAFDELDGPRFLRLSAAALGQQLKLDAGRVAELQATARPQRTAPREVRAWPEQKVLAGRMTASLWGLFIADALAMPVHWYYDVDALQRDYGEIQGYVAPQDRHATNGIMAGQWRQNKHRVRELVGSHMNFGKEKNWMTPHMHYHQGMSAGENTLNAHTARVVMRGLRDGRGTYNQTTFLHAYLKFLTTPGSHNDSYAEAVHRQWLANHLLEKRPMEDCAGDENHDTPSIGGFVMLPPIILTAVGRDPTKVLDDVERHLRITHRSDRLAAVANIYALLLLELLAGADSTEASARAGRQLGVDLPALLAHAERFGIPDFVVARELGMACYISHSFPVVLYLLHKYGAHPDGFRLALLANANAGGENCHRGSALGALLGAARGLAAVPEEWIQGLASHAELGPEIRGLVDAILADAEGQASKRPRDDL